MTATLLPISLDTVLDSNGNPISGARLRFYLTGTDTAAVVYLDATLTTAAPVPVLTDPAGRFPALYTSPDTVLRSVLADASGVPLGQRDIDPINPQDGGLRVSLYATLQEAVEAAAGQRLIVDADREVSASVTPAAGTTIIGGGGVLTASDNTFNMFTIVNDDIVIDGVIMRGPDIGELQTDFTTGFGVYMNGAQNCAVKNCDFRLFGQGGVFLFKGNYDIEISDNFISDCKWNISGGNGDITSYGGSGVGEGNVRIRILRNRCYSNTSAGLNCNVIGFDSDLEIVGNWCVPMNTSTWAPITGTAVMRRHAIAANYNGVVSPLGRIVVRNNYCANARWTGVYDQASSYGRNDVIIEGNTIVNCGQNAFVGPNAFPPNFGFPGGQYNVSPGIQGGVFTQITGGQVITGNNLISCPLGMTVAAPTTGLRSATIRGNSFIACDDGISITGTPLAVSINNNQFTASTLADIKTGITGGVTDTGGIDIRNNTFLRTVEGYCINIDSSSGVIQNYIVENKFIGPGASVNDANTAIHFRFPTVTVVNNVFRGFKRAFNFYAYLPTSTRYAGPARFDLNEIDGCTTAFGGGATSNTTLFPLVENTLLNGTALADGGTLGGSTAGVAVIRVGNTYEYADTAAPTTRAHAIGDRVRNSAPAVGQPKAWLCTVTAAPGTFVSEGNL